MYKILYWPFLFILWCFSIIPLKVHYFFSDILYFFLYKVFRYRYRVAVTNISRAFPQVSYKEVKKILSDFYHYLSDIIVESIWAYSASSERIAKLLDFRGTDTLNKAFDGGKNVMVVMGHQGNWELYTGLPDIKKTYGTKMDNEHFFYIYKKMANKFFDKILFKIRDRHQSCVLIEMHTIVRKMLKNKEQGGVYYFISDQYPGKGGGLEVMFLNQPTGIITGPEQISRKLALPVVFFDVEKVCRGHYKSDYTLICEDASLTEEGFVTREYARLLEKSINNNKSAWLWSHRRWKKRK